MRPLVVSTELRVLCKTCMNSWYDNRPSPAPMQANEQKVQMCGIDHKVSF
jgi:hypothetical protein